MYINIFFNFIPGLPEVSVTYSVQWSFAKILPSKCDNISTRLDDLENRWWEYSPTGAKNNTGFMLQSTLPIRF